MTDMKNSPTWDIPIDVPFKELDIVERYFKKTMDKFIEEHMIGDDNTSDGQDKIRMYNKHFTVLFTLEDYCDAVREGDGKRMAQIHKDFLLYFRTTPSYNA